MDSLSQIDEAEASREIYRVHLPGAENDLYSLLELRELALRKVIKPGTPISKEGGNVETPANSIPSVFSHRSRSVALAFWFIGLEALYLGDIKRVFIRFGLLSPIFLSVGLALLGFRMLNNSHSNQEFVESFFTFLAVAGLFKIFSTIAIITTVIAAFYWLKSGHTLFTRTAVDREGRPLLD